jgi:deoxyribodipyrimidine photo-lyase
VHPWSLGELPASLPADTKVIGVFLADFHADWPWSAQRWRFVGSRMAELATGRWHGDADAIGAALKGARSVRSIDEPHLAPWLPKWAACEDAPALFAPVEQRRDAFSPWWTRASRGLHSAADLLANNEAPSW